MMETMVSTVVQNFSIIAGGIGIIFLVLGFYMATQRPMTRNEWKSYEKDQYLRGKK